MLLATMAMIESTPRLRVYQLERLMSGNSGHDQLADHDLRRMLDISPAKHLQHGCERTAR